MEWHNYGDINFEAYGGCLVRPSFDKETLERYPSLANCYDLFYCNTEAGDNGDQIFAVLCMVDIKDSWIDKKMVLSCIGLEDMSEKPIEEIMEPERWAMEVVNCYGPGNFGGRSYRSEYPGTFEDYLVTQDELHEWLLALGAGNIIGNDLEAGA